MCAGKEVSPNSALSYKLVIHWSLKCFNEKYHPLDNLRRLWTRRLLQNIDRNSLADRLKSGVLCEIARMFLVVCGGNGKQDNMQGINY